MLSKSPAAPRERASRSLLPCVLLGSTLLGATGCEAERASSTPRERVLPEVQRLTPEQVKALLDRADDVTIVDVRVPRDYLAGHLPAAVSLPYVQLASRYRLLDSAATLLLYCQTERTSVLAAQQLARLGFSNLYILAGGFAGWRYAIESGYRPPVL